MVYKTNQEFISFDRVKLDLEIEQVESAHKMRSVYLSTVFDRSKPNAKIISEKNMPTTGIDMTTTILLKDSSYDSDKLKRDLIFFRKLKTLKLDGNFKLSEILPENISIELIQVNLKDSIGKLVSLFEKNSEEANKLEKVLNKLNYFQIENDSNVHLLISRILFLRIEIILKSIITGDTYRNFDSKEQFDDFVDILNDFYDNYSFSQNGFYVLNKKLDNFTMSLKERDYSNLKLRRNKNEKNSIKSPFNDFFDLYIDLFEKFGKNKDFLKFSVPFNLGGTVESLVKKYERIKLDEDFLFVDWRELSSGQEALIDVFSRLYEVARKVRHNQIIYLFLDEVDNMLHPEWQRNLIMSLIQTINAVFTRNSIQIIISSHSPFILSDLPHTNIIYLGDNRVEASEKTVGANIHTLFANSFFMENGTIGEFSKQKINCYQNELFHLNRMDEKYKEFIRRFILTIGEPIIQKAFDIKFKKMNIDIEGQIAETKKKINENVKLLEELKNEKNRNEK